MKRYALLLAFLALSCQAGVYKWTDSQGRVHYTDTPPPQQAAQQVRTDKANEAEAEAARKALAEKLSESDRRRKSEQEAEARRKAQEEEKRKQAENCQRAREQLILLQQSTRIGRVDQRGQRYIMEEAERQTAIAEAQKRVGELCK